MINRLLRSARGCTSRCADAAPDGAGYALLSRGAGLPAGRGCGGPAALLGNVLGHRARSAVGVSLPKVRQLPLPDGLLLDTRPWTLVGNGLKCRGRTRLGEGSRAK